jgi:hypothetical protein
MRILDWFKAQAQGNGSGKGKSTLSAVITVGNEESARTWSAKLGRPVEVGEQIDLGVISEGELHMEVKSSG